MRKHLTTLLTVIGAVTVLVLAANTVALATTGKALIAGKTNTSSKITALSRTTSGVPLKITSQSTANSPLAVNGKGKVVNLNADKVDGLDAADLRAGSYVFNRTIATAVVSLTQSISLPVGSYQVSYSAYLSGGAGDGNAGCYLRLTHEGVKSYVGESRGPASTTTSPGLTGGGFVTVAGGDALDLVCAAPSDFKTATGEPIQIVATPMERLGTITLRQSARTTTK